MAPAVARILATELGKDDAWAAAQLESFLALAEQYTLRRTIPGKPMEAETHTAA
jgi:hypothetical protein